MAYVVALKQWVADQLAAKAASVHGHTLDDTTDTATRLALTPGERTKLTNTSGTNTGDQDLSGLVTLGTAQTITGAKTITAAALVAATPAPVFSAALQPALSAWIANGGATWGGTTWTIPSGASISCTIPGVISGQTYQVDVTRTASTGGPMVVQLGTISIAPDSWGNASVTLIAAESGSLTLTLGGGTWVASVSGVVVRQIVASPSARTTGFELRTYSSNVAVGTSAQTSLTTGSENVATGTSAQRNLTTGYSNVAAGTSAQTSLTTGSSNVAVGTSAQTSLTTGSENVAAGTFAQSSLTTGYNNVAAGTFAQTSLTTGGGNVATGTSAQRNLTTGSSNVAAGTFAQTSLTTGGSNVATGTSAQRNLTTGYNNVAVGTSAQYSPLGNNAFATTTGSQQTSVGRESGQGSATQVDDITTIGYRAVAAPAAGVALGARASVAAGHTGSVAIGADTTTTAASQVAVGARDIEVQGSAVGVVLRSPDGSRWRITVGNTGTLTTAKL